MQDAYHALDTSVNLGAPADDIGLEAAGAAVTRLFAHILGDVAATAEAAGLRLCAHTLDWGFSYKGCFVRPGPQVAAA